MIEVLAKDGSLSQGNIAERIGVGKRTVARYMNELMELDMVERIGTDTKGYYILKVERLR